MSQSTPVLIAGAGPVGLVAAYTLAHYGIECMLIERNATTTAWPKMDITNVRSMEILRRLGLADELREQGEWQNTISSPKLCSKRNQAVDAKSCCECC
jgi:2-polyprenyl-6-methoxyphenol hydroxylase-like FAD-dependent oxidoreductase